MAYPAALGFMLTGLLMAAAAYLITRGAGRFFRSAGSGRNLQVLEALPMGRDRALYLVRVGGDTLLIGSAPGGISLVHTLPSEAVPGGAAAPADTFAQWLTRFGGRQRAGGRQGGGADA